MGQKGQNKYGLVSVIGLSLGVTELIGCCRQGL
jgi:hypothetical protein